MSTCLDGQPPRQHGDDRNGPRQLERTSTSAPERQRRDMAHDERFDAASPPAEVAGTDEQAAESRGVTPAEAHEGQAEVPPGPAPMIDPAPDAGGDASDVTGLRALVGRSRERVAAEQARINALIEKYHDRPLLDVGLRIYQRDREGAGSVVGSALAFRLFLFFVP